MVANIMSVRKPPLNPLFRFLDFSPFPHRPTLFKYKELLENHRLYFSDPKYFNDPFDCLPSFQDVFESFDPSIAIKRNREQAMREGRPALRDGAVEYALMRVIDDLPTQFEWYTDHVRPSISSKLRILCLTESIDSIRMWSYYSASHKGFAVEINLQGLPFSEMGFLLHEVNYDRPRIQTDIEFNTNIKAICTTKEKGWDYEREWRYVVPNEPPIESNHVGQYVTITQDTIRSIYLGFNSNLNYDEECALYEFSRWSPSTKFFRVFPHAREFKLVPNEFDTNKLKPKSIPNDYSI